MLRGSGRANLLESLGGADLIQGREGADDLRAGAGADRVEARDGAADAVNCGADADTAIADAIGIDALAGCERVERPAAAAGGGRGGGSLRGPWSSRGPGRPSAGCASGRRVAALS